MATKLYTRNSTAGFTPTNFRGSWNQTSSSVTKQLTTVSNETDGGILTPQLLDSSATSPFDMLGGRMVSAPLATGITFSGTVDSWIGGFASGAGGPLNSRWYIYVTVGDTNTVRGVLLDYAEPPGTNDWDFVSTNLSYHMATPQAVAPIVALAGDRIVAEIGVRSSNVTATAIFPNMKFGGTATLPPLSATNTDNRFAVAWIEFSDTLDIQPKVRASQSAVEVIYTPIPFARVTRTFAEVIYSPIAPARLSRQLIEVIYATRAPADVSLTVGSTGTVAQTITPRADRLKSLLAVVTVTSDPQISGLGAINRNASSTVAVAQTVDFAFVQRQVVTSTVTVAQAITLTDAGPHLFVTSTITVAQAIVAHSTGNRQSVTSTGTVGQDSRHSPRDIALTSLVTVTSLPFVIPDITKSLTSTVHVSDEIVQRGPINAPPITSFINIGQGADGVTTAPRLFIATAVTVAQTITATVPNKHVAVLNTATVSQTLLAVGNQPQSVTQPVTVVSEAIGRNTDPRRSILTTANVAQEIAFRNSVIRQTVTQPVTVLQPPAVVANSVVRITVTSNITVTQAATGRNNNVRLSVLTECGVSVPTSERDTGVETPCSNTATVTTTQTGVAYPPHHRLSQIVTVTDLITPENSNPRPGINSFCTVAQTVSVFSGRFAITSAVSVAQTIGFRNTNPRIALTSNAVVGTPITSWNSNNRIAMVHLVSVGPINRPMAQFHINPVRIHVREPIVVGSTFTGGSPIHLVSMSDHVSVVCTLASSFSLQSVENTVTVGSAVTGGGPTRNEHVTSNATISSLIGSRNADVYETVTDEVLVEHLVYAQGPKVATDIETEIVTEQTIIVAIVRAMRLIHSVTVTQTIVPQSLHQALTSGVTVAQTISARSDQPRETVTSAVAVTSRPKIDEMIVRHFVNVVQKYTRLSTVHFLQSIVLGQSVDVERTYTETITHDTEINQSLERQVDWDRVIEQRIVLPGDTYERDVSLGPGTILVPVVTGVFVAKFMTFQSLTSVIILPTPEFEDTEGVVGEIDIKRSMNGLAYAHTKSTDRRKLNYPFKLSLSKALELKAFMKDSLSKPVYVTDWKGQQWFGFFTSNPFELTSEGRYGSQKEKIAVEIELEAVKL